MRQRYSRSPQLRPRATVPALSGDERDQVVELTRVPRFEAQVIAARLRASGIDATVGADLMYDSLSFAEGVAVYVSAEDAARARALLQGVDEPDD